MGEEGCLTGRLTGADITGGLPIALRSAKLAGYAPAPGFLNVSGTHFAGSVASNGGRQLNRRVPWLCQCLRRTYREMARSGKP